MLCRQRKHHKTKQHIESSVKPRQKSDELAVNQIHQWLNQMEPFDETRDKDVLISFSTGFYSKGDDGVNPERAIKVGNSIQAQLDGQVPSAKLELKQKVKPLSVLRKQQPAIKQGGTSTT